MEPEQLDDSACQEEQRLRPLPPDDFDQEAAFARAEEKMGPDWTRKYGRASRNAALAQLGFISPDTPPDAEVDV